MNPRLHSVSPLAFEQIDRIPADRASTKAASSTPRVRSDSGATDAAEPAGESSPVDAETLSAYLPGAAYVFEVSAAGALSFPFVSAACADIYGFTAEAAMADVSLMHGAIHPEDQDSFDRAGQRSAQRLCPMHWEGRLLRADGDTRNVVITSRPRRLDHGVTQWHGIVIDRTDAHERDVVERLELVRRSQHQGDLLAMASHDIGAPLASVLGYAEQALSIVEDDPEDAVTKMTDSADLQLFLRRIIRNAQRIDDLRRDLLISQAWDSGQLSVEPQSTLVRSKVMAAVESLPGGPEIRISCPPGLRCYTQASHLDQMLTNLLTNAGRFAREQVTVRAHATGQTTVITVSDDGPGVPEEFVDKLFDRFTRAAASAGSGTGLGLFITRKLAVANGGQVRYEPASTGGATFTIELPRLAK